MKSRCTKQPMADGTISVLTTLSSTPVIRHTAFYHVMLFILIHGLRHARGVKIYNCNNNKVEIFEDSPAPVTCGDITSTNDVVWRRGDGVSIGVCSADGRCSPALYNDYIVSRSAQSTESQLTLVPDYRRHAGVTVTCQDKGGVSTASCTLVIRRRSELSECHVTTNPVDWTVSGSCRVQQAFSPDNIYTCTWTRNTGQPFGGFDASRELCSFTQALPQAGGLYTYSISVSPPAATAFSQQLTLVEPGDVTTTCPHWVVRGRDLSCTCQTTNTASPPATVRWEGRDSEKLVKTNVQREDNGTQFTCHVTWAGRVYTSITYTLMVKSVEGPSDVIINKTHHPGNNGTSIVTLSCNTTGAVYPGVNFTWSPGVCQNETHTARSSTCTVRMETHDDGRGVTCTAINSIDSRISVSKSVTLMINGSEIFVVESPSTDFTSVRKPTHVIIGVVVAAGGIAVIAAVAAILIRKRRCRLQKAPADSVQLPLGSSEIVTDVHRNEIGHGSDHSYTNLCITEVSPTAQPQGASEGEVQVDMYENTQTDQTYDTTIRQHDEHRYSDLKVQSKVKVTAQDPRDSNRRIEDMYYNA
ncbi:uncharacterized protein LOC112568973 [Pomacea canaliculata]|uniref:uncharacterized protein LOC112568973 n=1 Tax=Pomacea canaliculata TaxID=400727 RepID=UPI000D72E24B|nr:uncharacterized protein LOC112568973 [Pomacea canaliculata]